ncbi:hypothetical protein BDZ89DRAFT_1153443 [Hymenopellis radicata]|nr:hypothetical protein BDZ89DRAFT_1153443 [Hymenopellis radicata]
MFSASKAVIRQAHRRSFVSPAVLSRTWDQHTVNDLKKEARARGLSQSGSKNTLVRRLQEHEKGISSSAIAHASASGHVVGDAPGIPPTHEFHAPVPEGFMNVKIPDDSMPDVQPTIQIPFVPDFWASPSAAQEEIPIPKILVVAGAETHHGGGPATTAIDTEAPLEESTSSSSTPQPVLGQGGFWDDAAESLGLPYPNQVSAAVSQAYAAFKTTVTGK